VCATRSDLEKLSAAIQADPQLPVSVDLKSMQVRYADQSIPCTMPASAREALISGKWDFLGQLLDHRPEILRKKEELPYLSGFAAT
jgi:3-isopropylmalate/(R)-2-methylmalate dehydratase small subunit